MSTPPGKSTILLIGNEPMLTYLLGRYAEQSGCRIVMRETAPSIGETEQNQPAAIIFASIDQLQMEQPYVDAMSTREIPVLVCASVSDEARARELGADECLLHPLTYDQFCAVLSHTCPAEKG